MGESPIRLRGGSRSNARGHNKSSARRQGSSTHPATLWLAPLVLVPAEELSAHQLPAAYRQRTCNVAIGINDHHANGVVIVAPHMSGDAALRMRALQQCVSACVRARQGVMRARRGAMRVPLPPLRTSQSPCTDLHVGGR